MNNEEAKQLIIKYNKDQCTQAEKRMLENWYNQLNEHEIDLSPERIKGIGARIYNELPGPENSFKRIRLWPSFVAAVAVLIFTLGI